MATHEEGRERRRRPGGRGQRFQTAKVEKSKPPADSRRLNSRWCPINRRFENIIFSLGLSLNTSSTAYKLKNPKIEQIN
jgi:hypothetical protein